LIVFGGLHLQRELLNRKFEIKCRRKNLTSPGSSEVSDTDNFVADRVSIAMRRIFDAADIRHLDIADGLKQLLYEKHCDLNFLLQSDAATVAQELGIEKYVAQIIIDAAKKATTE
jgi:hypothetical protein